MHDVTIGDCVHFYMHDSGPHGIVLHTSPPLPFHFYGYNRIFVQYMSPDGLLHKEWVIIQGDYISQYKLIVRDGYDHI